jgi:predicted RNA-binding protein with PIN domain
MPSRNLIIDGYNVIFRLARDAEFRPGGVQRLRTELEAAVARYGRKRGIRPWIVYDGKSMGVSHAGARELEHLKVSYADPPAEADDMICEMARQIREKGRTVEVVTSDAGLADRLRQMGAETVSVEAFQDRLGTTRAGPRPQVGDIEAHFLALERSAVGRAEPAGEDHRAESSDSPPAPGRERGSSPVGPDTEQRRRRGQRRQQRRLQALQRRTGERRKRRH